MNPSETGECLAILKAAWPNHPVTQETVVAYHTVIGNLDRDSAMEVVADALRTCRFFPQPSELLSLLAERRQMHKLADEAWSEVMRRVRMCGIYYGERWGREPEPWSSDEIAKAVESVGYRNICTSEKPEIIRAQFVKAYDLYVERAKRNMLLGPLDEHKRLHDERMIELSDGRVDGR